MLSFLPQRVPRTNTSTLNPIFYEGGRSSQQFHDPFKPYMVTHTIPPSTPEHGPSMFNPPLHLHLYQLEEFRVRSGHARFYLENKSHDRHPGETIKIPVGSYHRFENVSPSENLVVDFRLDPQDFEMEERFFRNFFGYLEDCSRAKTTPSIFQLLLFLYTVDGPLAVPCPGPRWIGRQLSWLLMVVVGVGVGQYLLGYQGSYEEYYAGRKRL